MQTIFTLSLGEITERYRKRLSALPLAKGMSPPDTSRIEIQTDEQIGRVLAFIGWMHSFEINHWFSFVSWSRETEAPNTIRIVVEGDGPVFEVINQAIAAELSN
jgi:hypothetical protein